MVVAKVAEEMNFYKQVLSELTVLGQAVVNLLDRTVDAYKSFDFALTIMSGMIGCFICIVCCPIPHGHQGSYGSTVPALAYQCWYHLRCWSGSAGGDPVCGVDLRYSGFGSTARGESVHDFGGQCR